VEEGGRLGRTQGGVGAVAGLGGMKAPDPGFSQAPSLSSDLFLRERCS
jgi:hypothetical protein